MCRCKAAMKYDGMTALKNVGQDSKALKEANPELTFSPPVRSHQEQERSRELGAGRCCLARFYKKASKERSQG